MCEFRKQNTTGGGPPPLQVPDLYMTIVDLIPAQFERISNEFDDDANEGKVQTIFNGNLL